MIHICVMLSGVLIASVAQALLKTEAIKPHGSKFKEYLNINVIAGYGMMLLCTVCTAFAYKVIPISLGMILEATGYIYVTLIGYIVFDENINIKRIIALTMIIMGIVVYALIGYV